MAAFLRRNSYRGGKSPALLLARLRAEPQAPLALPAATLAAMVSAHVQQLRTLQATICGIEHLIAGRVAEHPRAQLLRDLPGIGTINLAQILAEVGPILDRTAPPSRPPPNAAPPRSPALPARPPAPASAGPQHPGPQGHHRLRPRRPDAITLGGQALRRRPGPRQRNPHATRIVARAWIRVIWACWHTGIPYDPATHQARQRLTG
jgi:hypothetical protein